MGGDVTCVAPAANISGLPLHRRQWLAQISLNSQTTPPTSSPSLSTLHLAFWDSAPARGRRGRYTRPGERRQLHGTSDYRCAFGGTTLPVRAEPYNGSDATLFCRVQAHTHAPRLISVEISLNAQQYTRDGTLFSVHAPAHVAALSPTSGPSMGATVTVIGGPFENGTDYRCRFDPYGPTSAGVPVGAPQRLLP